MKNYRNWFHLTNKEKLAITTAIAILSIMIITGMENKFSNVNAQTDITNNTLSVSGSATAQAISDEVTASMGVETTNTTAQAALTSNSNFMNAVLEALKAAGVQENETSSATFSITPNYNYSSNANQGRLIGFTVGNSIQIKSSNIESVSKWIDAAVSAGANNVNNIYFSVSNKKLDEIKNSLLKDAIDNAKAKADIAASAAGLQVLGVKSIGVEDIRLPPPAPIYSASAINSEAAASTPIISGQQEVSESVTIVYFIGR